ncbi:outer membrane beta-barrel protein [Flavobacterium sp.]|jgi:hypothetical protein|uniref:outer membrane beta-barrel protein n=1 Tax=Flavobacterium sp. TaxID=239 RepID=UPI0038FD22BE
MKKVITILALALTTTVTFAQDTPLEISGSADLYYKYDFSKLAQIPTSFATDQNSVSLGMIDIALKKKTGKTSFVGEVSFGPRGAGQSIPEVGGQSFHIQNLYAAYAASDKLTLTAGYMATFVGYEVISPLGNLHYSTSYLFTNGPFQNAGIKANYAISSKVGLMVGLFNNDWNLYQADADLGLNNIGAQLSLTPFEGFTAYINYLDGSSKGTIIDLTAAYQISEKFKLGLNAADFAGVGEDTGYTGFALYPSYAVSSNFGLGLRAESFKSKKNSFDTSVTALTLSANLKSGGLTFIPEFRMDNNSDEILFEDSDGAPAKSASQISLAVVYGF